MKWTRERALRAVAAKERLRIERANVEIDCTPVNLPRIRAARPDFKISIESKRGERLQISIWRSGRGIFTNCGIDSARRLCRGLELMITKSA